MYNTTMYIYTILIFIIIRPIFWVNLTRLFGACSRRHHRLRCHYRTYRNPHRVLVDLYLRRDSTGALVRTIDVIVPTWPVVVVEPPKPLAVPVHHADRALRPVVFLVRR